MLPEDTIIPRIILSVRVIEKAVLDKGAEFRIPIVIAAGNHLPGEVCMVFSIASEYMRGGFDFDVRRLRVISAYASPGIRLESAQGQPPDEVSHKRPGINPSTRASATSCKEDRRFASRNSVTRVEYLTQCEISVAPEAIIEKISFDGRAKYAGAKDVTKFYAAEDADVIVRMDRDSVGSEKIELISTCSSFAAVMKPVGTEIDGPIKTGSVKFRCRWGDLFVGDGFAGSKRTDGPHKNCC